MTIITKLFALVACCFLLGQAAFAEDGNWDCNCKDGLNFEAGSRAACVTGCHGHGGLDSAVPPGKVSSIQGFADGAIVRVKDYCSPKAIADCVASECDSGQSTEAECVAYCRQIGHCD